MRGADQQQGSMYSYVTMERRIRKDHPVRRIRGLVDRALEGMDTLLDMMYASQGRPSIAPERLLRAQLLMILYFDPIGAAVDGAIGLQPVVPVVCGS